MKQLILALIIILVIATVCNAQSKAQVTGTITDCTSGAPLENVAITAGSSNPVYTDAEGNYTLNISNGMYDLVMEKEDYISLLIDNINLTGLITMDTCLSMDYPSMGVSPNEIIFWLEPGGSLIHTEEISLTNYGSSTVTWNSVVEYTTGEEFNWLSSLDQLNGSILPGETNYMYFEINAENITYHSFYEAIVYFYYGEGNFVKELYVGFQYGWLSIDEVSDDLHLNILPNPAKSKINIESSGEKSYYQIFNINERVVMSGELCQNTISIEALPPGIYILKLEDENHQVSVGKFVKQ
jgi:hypothetical protein